jgi:hypothetical protein
MHDPVDVLIVHRAARMIATALWALGDALGHLERFVYAVSRRSNDAGHATLQRACTYTEERLG